MRPSKRLFTIPTTENASFNSHKSISSDFNPALSNATGIASEGEVVNHSGACAASAIPSIFAIGLRPWRSTASSEAKINALAPSFSVEAFAAVIVPSLSNAGRKDEILSILTFLYSSSSAKTMGSPLRCGICTATVSELKAPLSQAAEALS